MFTLGVCWNYLKFQAPNKPALRSIDLRLFERYIEFLFGPKVWGNATRSLEGHVFSTPTISMVMSYDWQVRKAVVALLNSGMDYASALAQVKNDDRHF